MKSRAYYSILCSGLKYIKRNLDCVSKGPLSSFMIIKQAHKLEKGLSISEPRRLWGYSNAMQLVEYIAMEQTREEPDQFSINIGKAVLSAYLNYKSQLQDAEEETKTKELKDYIFQKIGSADADPAYGGTLVLRRGDILVDESAVAPLFITRHSVRDFADTPVDQEQLERAVAYALRAPSACNRQPTQIYVFDGKDREKAGADNTYYADKYLILTGNMNAFTMGELNDWIVSAAIFAGYLTLALSAVGIGSCVYRKDMILNSKYNDQVRKLCKIPDNEQIILEIAIGNYKEEFNVPVSYRRDAKDIIHYL